MFETRVRNGIYVGLMVAIIDNSGVYKPKIDVTCIIIFTFGRLHCISIIGTLPRTQWKRSEHMHT